MYIENKKRCESLINWHIRGINWIGLNWLCLLLPELYLLLSIVETFLLLWTVYLSIRLLCFFILCVTMTTPKYRRSSYIFTSHSFLQTTKTPKYLCWTMNCHTILCFVASTNIMKWKLHLCRLSKKNNNNLLEPADYYGKNTMSTWFKIQDLFMVIYDHRPKIQWQTY